MDYLFRCLKRTLNLENNKCIYQGNFFVYHVTESAYSKIILQANIFQGYMQNFERNWKNPICIRVTNFAKSVNFQVLRVCSQRKN